MAIYMQLGSIKGNVTTSSYADWIDCQEVEFCGIDNTVSQRVGNDMDRVTNHPKFGMIRLSKYLDQSSIDIFQAAHKHQVIPSTDIHYVNVNDPIFTFSKINLKDVIVTHYSELYTSTQHYKPIEHIILAYTQIEKTYIPQATDGKAGSPITSGFNLSNGQPL